MYLMLTARERLVHRGGEKVRERERKHHSFLDSAGRHAPLDRRSFTRLPSSASDMEGDSC